MQSFDIVTLRVFLAVERSGSIGAAARSEHIAASAVSRRISDLEHDLDAILITRTPTGVSLTPAGKAFARHSEQLLAKYADIRTDLKRYADGKTGELRIAVVPWAMRGSLPFVIAAFKRSHPEVHLTVQEIFTLDGIRYLREDLADLVIIYDSVDLSGFEMMTYKKNPIWVVGHQDHPLFQKYAANDPIDFKDTLDYEQISFHEGGALDEVVAEARRKEGRGGIKHDIKVMRAGSLLKCAEAGLGLGLIGEHDLQLARQKGKNLKALPLADDWALRKLVCVYPSLQTASPIVKSFLDCLTDK